MKNNSIIPKKGSKQQSHVDPQQLQLQQMQQIQNIQNIQPQSQKVTTTITSAGITSCVQTMQTLKTQCGGHKGMRQGNKGKYASVAKPMPTEREAVFYKKIKSTPLYQCLPKFLGVTTTSSSSSISYSSSSGVSSSSSAAGSSSISSSISSSSSGSAGSNLSNWLLLQDLTANMTSPCIADLKIGTRSYEVGVPQWKSERQISLNQGTTTISHAVRCIDICIRKNNSVVHQWDRKQGRKMSWRDLEKAMKMFFSMNVKSSSSKNGHNNRPLFRVEQFAEQLKILRSRLVETLEVFPNLRLYSASVLVIYDGDRENSPITLKLIDFGHGYIDVAAEGGNVHDQSYDDNALLGIDNLLSIADSLLCDQD